MAFIDKEKMIKLESKMITDKSVLGKHFTSRKKDYDFLPVAHNLVENYENEGYEVDAILKTKTRLRKEKSFPRKFEDDIWCQIYQLGFRELNRDENLELHFGKGDSEKKQIDVLAIKDDIALIIECKSSLKLKKHSFKDEFELLGVRLDGFRKTLEQYKGRPLRVKYIFATRNLRLEAESVDMERLTKTNSFHYNDNTYKYVNSLISKYKGVAEYQFLGLLFRDEIINLNKIEIPALEGSMGGLKYYMFSIEPGILLRMSFILHRTKANEEEMPTYQRLLVPSRLKQLTKFIDGEDEKGGGFFPNSLIVNFNTKGKNKINFIPGSSKDQTKAKFGTLSLPNAYRIAYVIDGQHRLYGYANSKFKDTSTIPVVAFTDLPSLQQLKMFVDINENQKPVSKTLRETLKKDLGWNSKYAKERMDALVSAITIKLAEDSSSPLFNKIEVGEDSALIKMASFTDSLRKSGLIPVARGNIYDKEQNYDALFYDIANQNHELEMNKSLKRVYEFICLVYDYISTEYYNLYTQEGDFILSDRGVMGMIFLLGDVNKYLILKKEIDINTSSKDRFSLIEKYIAALCNGLEKIEDEEKSNFKIMTKGAGREKKWTVFFMKIINQSINDYNPIQLVEWRETQDQELQKIGRDAGVSTEKYLKKAVLYNLKQIFGDQWELEINSIKRELINKAEEEKERQWKSFKEKVNPKWTEMFEILHYKDIIKKYWTNTPEGEYTDDSFITFESLFSLDLGLGFSNKAEKVKWIDKLNSSRKNYAHEGSKETGLTKKQVDYLEMIFKHCEKNNKLYPPN